MRYRNIVRARFIERPNRFIARCELDGKVITAHVRNTGRLRELFVPGTAVFLERSERLDRKTGFSVITIEKGNRLVNIDSTVPNKVLREAVECGLKLPGLDQVKLIKSEKQFNDSRFDFYIETDNKKAFVEVKGVTLEEKGMALFPDAPTERGVKHLKELAEAAAQGYEAYVVFIIQMKGISCFAPNVRTHPEFGAELKKAYDAGVHVLCYDCHVGVDYICLGDPVPVIL